MSSFILRSLSLIALAVCLHAQANPILTLARNASSTESRIVVDLMVHGVAMPQQTIGGFDIALQYDPGYLDMLSVHFGAALGAPGDRVDRIVFTSPASDAATVRMFSVSFLEEGPESCTACTGPYLVDTQGSDFLLATLEFDWIAPMAGSTILRALSADLSDGTGNILPIAQIQPLQIAVPEPSCMWLVVAGMLVMPFGTAGRRAVMRRHARVLLAGAILGGAAIAQAQDRDRVPYILVITENPPLSHWLFDYPDRALAQIGATSDLHIAETSIGNFDGDALITWDFLAATRDNPAALYLYRRDIYFGFTRRFVGMLEPDPKAEYYIARGQPELAPDYGLGIIAGDLDNDGDTDFLEAVNRQFGDGLFWIARGNAWLNDGSGQFTKVKNAFDFSSIFTGWTLGMSSTLADLNGDGYADFLVSEQPSGGDVQSRVYALFGNGDGTFGAPVHVFTSPHPATFISIGDVNNNGTADALVGMDDDGDPGQVYLFLGLGNGEFIQQAYEAFDSNPEEESGVDRPGGGKFQLTDLTEDGVLDVVISASPTGPLPDALSSGNLRLFRGLGDGRFEPRFDLGTTFVNTAFSAPYLEPVEVRLPGDFVGDRHIDRRDVDFLATLLERQGASRPAMGPHDPFDLNHDGVITVADVRRLVLLCTRPRCALPPSPPDHAMAD